MKSKTYRTNLTDSFFNSTNYSDFDRRSSLNSIDYIDQQLQEQYQTVIEFE